MKSLLIILVLFMPTLTFAHSVSYGKDILLIFTIGISFLCLIASFFVSFYATSPMSIFGLILFALISFIPAIMVIQYKKITFDNSSFLYPVQVSFWVLLAIPLFILFLFTLKWLKNYNNLEKQNAPDWRELKDSLENNLKNNPLECSLFEKGIKNTACLNLDNGKYILTTHSSGRDNESLVTENKFDSIELLNKYLSNSTNFRLRDFLNN